MSADDGLTVFSTQFFRQVPQISSSSLFLSISPADGSFLTVVPLRIGIEGIPPDWAIASNPCLKE